MHTALGEGEPAVIECAPGVGQAKSLGRGVDLVLDGQLDGVDRVFWDYLDGKCLASGNVDKDLACECQP